MIIQHKKESADLDLLRRVVGDLSRLEPGPLVSLDPDADSPKGGRDNKNLHTHSLSVVHLRLGSPVEELNDILGHLRGGGGGPILVFDKALVEDTSHSDTGTGEVGVEVHAGGDLDTSGRLLGVTSEQAEDVITATVAGLDDERQIRGQGTVVGKSGSLLVLVRGKHVVGQLSGTHLDLALLIGLTGVLVLLGKGLGLVDGQDGTDESSVGDSAKGVAGLANLLVDLETTAETANGVSNSAWRVE
ncbi:unnamed protein product [Fusarium graminearum]|nr:unnamed protein product [Fusarium graminearum]